jgi:hypothetical protein
MPHCQACSLWATLMESVSHQQRMMSNLSTIRMGNRLLVNFADGHIAKPRPAAPDYSDPSPMATVYLVSWMSKPLGQVTNASSCTTSPRRRPAFKQQRWFRKFWQSDTYFKKLACIFDWYKYGWEPFASAQPKVKQVAVKAAKAKKDVDTRLLIHHTSVKSTITFSITLTI